MVRKSYRCQPGKRRDVLAALQRIDAAAAEAGYPRGRYVFVETRAPGEPDLEVEFAFESYAEMERLERAMRERVARYLRDGGATGMEHLLEPSATKHLLLLEEGARAQVATQTAAVGQTTQTAAPAARGSAPTAPGSASLAPAAPAAGARQPARPAAPTPPPDLSFDDETDEEFEEPPEPDVPPAPAPPPGMSDDEFRRSQLTRARSALQSAERTVGAKSATPRSAGPARSPRPQ